MKRVPWHRFLTTWRKTFSPGDHVTIVGPTGAGKTHLAVAIVEPRKYVLFLATKPKDPLITELQRHGYRITRDLDIRVANGKVVDRKVVFWPYTQELKELHEYQAEEIQRAFAYVFRSGSWTVVADETIWMAKNLKLERIIEAAAYQWRTLNASLVAVAQRPAWVPRALYSQPEHLFLFATSDKEDLKRLGDIGGSDVDEIRQTVQNLERYEFAYYNTRKGVLLVSKVERPSSNRRVSSRNNKAKSVS